MASVNSVAKIRESVSKYVPAAAVDRLAEHIVRRAIHVRVVLGRKSKYGYYRVPTPSSPYHVISVNGDLTPDFFLLVMLHELAHLEVRVGYGGMVRPHGHEWQGQYRQLLLCYRDCFPPEAQVLIDRYTRDIPLHGPTGKRLDRLLMNWEREVDIATTILNDLPEGSLFRINGKAGFLFISIEKRRTRWLCCELGSQRLVTVSGDAPVTRVIQ